MGPVTILSIISLWNTSTPITDAQWSSKRTVAIGKCEKGVEIIRRKIN
jgi:hypothetical protein